MIDPSRVQSILVLTAYRLGYQKTQGFPVSQSLAVVTAQTPCLVHLPGECAFVFAQRSSPRDCRL
jgi:hypothetical protein